MVNLRAAHYTRHPSRPSPYTLPKNMLLQTIIFISGGAILALELLASRIMTPYFGVSL